MVEQLTEGETGVEKYEIASEEGPSVMTVAERVRDLARDELGRAVDIQLVDNPRNGETLVEDFPVETSKARARLDWQPEHTLQESIQNLLRTNADAIALEEPAD